MVDVRRGLRVLQRRQEIGARSEKTLRRWSLCFSAAKAVASRSWARTGVWRHSKAAMRATYREVSAALANSRRLRASIEVALIH